MKTFSPFEAPPETNKELALAQEDRQQHSRRDFLKLASSALGALLLMGLSPLTGQAASLPMGKNKALATAKPSAPLLALTPTTTTSWQAINFMPQLATVTGISQAQLQAHHKLYESYVAKTATITKAINALSVDALADANATWHPYRELLVERSFAQNGAWLHELYFENMGGSKVTASSAFTALINRFFGDWATFKAKAIASAKAMRGWAVLAYALHEKQLYFYGLDAHNQYAPLASVPLLVIDVYEHAYMLDFSTNRGAYLEQFWQTINWQVVEQRLVKALASPN
jgi:superoxide dismutase, Fe-Mn family